MIAAAVPPLALLATLLGAAVIVRRSMRLTPRERAALELERRHLYC